MKVAFVSLGCAKNLVNTEQMMALVRQAGHTVAGEAAGADVAVLNTCGFIDSAKSEAIQNILELAALKDEGKLKKLLVTGCLSQRYQKELVEELPEVDGVLGTGSYTEIVSALEEVMAGGRPFRFGDIDHTQEDGARLVSTPPYTAYLKIAEGCDNRCAYCVIPYLRGRYRSRKMDDVLYEARMLAESGVRELIVVAQDTSRYGTDLPGHRRLLPELLHRLCEIEKLHWIRVHYVYPDEIDDALIDTIAREEKIVKYLDLPIQHCNDKILAAMNRRGSGEFISELLTKLRERIPGLVIRTSLITGLPGEGEEEFAELCEFLKKHRMERVGAFPFSPEEGTPAAKMDYPDGETAQRRAEMVEELQSRIMDDYNASMVGKTVEVLVDGFDEEAQQFYGRTYADSPEIDGRVWLASGEALREGSFVQVRIDAVSDGDLCGYVMEESI